MEFSDSLLQFNILNAIKHSIQDHSIYHIDKLFEIMDDDLLEFLGDLNFSDFTNTELDEFIMFNDFDNSCATNYNIDAPTKSFEPEYTSSVIVVIYKSV